MTKNHRDRNNSIRTNRTSAFVLYANASSLLDNTNGASKSIRLILEALADHQCLVHAVMGCTSDCKEGFKKNQSIWLKKVTKNKDQKLKRFKQNHVNYSLVATDHWSRRYVAADEQEIIYRESVKLIKSAEHKFENKILIGWGNLLLEEAIFRCARQHGFKTFFYLANPTYKGKNNQTIELSSLIISDSMATKKLYQDEIKSKILVLPKCIEPPLSQQTAKERWAKQNITFVNPKPEKGFEALLTIANILCIRESSITIQIADPANKLNDSLNQLGLQKSALPKNVNVVGAFTDTDSLLSDTSCLLLLSLWHESGSRLIHECHLRGIPVLGFATGGTTELLSQHANDLFPKPITIKNQKKIIKIREWDCNEMVERILLLLTNFQYYDTYSQDLIEKSKDLYNHNSQAAKMILNALIKDLDSDT